MPSTGPPIFGCVHVAPIGRFEPILRALLDAIERSGLRAATTRVMAGVVGPEVDLSWLPPWVEIVRRDGKLELGECSTLAALWDWSKSTVGPGLAWYAHTKGASHTEDEGAVASIANINAWVDMLTYFTIERWRECAAALEEYDICGCDWTPRNAEWFKPVIGHVGGAGAWCQPGSGFQGNFWWSTLDHLRSLPPDEVFLDANRYCAEWLFIGCGNPRALELHGPHMNLYAHHYQRSRYEGASIGSGGMP